MLDGTDRATPQIRWCRNVKNIQRKRKAGSRWTVRELIPVEMHATKLLQD